MREMLPAVATVPSIPSELDAVYAFLVAAGVALLVTPLTMRFARRVGAVDQPRERGLSDRETPLLGGLAIFVAAAVAGAIWLPAAEPWIGIALAAALITVVGALDDRFDFPPWLKLAGQIGAAVIAVAVGGVDVKVVTLPFFGHLSLPNSGHVLTAIGLVAMMNVVNFSDGVDGLAAGVCSIVAIAFAVIAFSLAAKQGQHLGGVLAALTAGAAIGFLFHNFPPASSFMGDAGSNLLGLLMGCIAVQGDLKTSAVVTLALPLILLAVPFLDTTFVVLKRLKYRQPVYVADQEHFHHRMARIGFSVRRTVLIFYGWTLLLAGYAVALRFIHYSNHHGHLYAGGTVLVVGLGLIVAAASVYLVYVLEILKFNRRNRR
ncbi:MAG TPA: MraY family glycosyltransferase [Solirubrobacteraceae bacterium]|jgi:UDP-GlcNAc:undecaprenyl-phosphate GlcNAc-1-phosphate transferase|nr:MraY family glycosyltransferase [Solirubrobacteraceae bacterium]